MVVEGQVNFVPLNLLLKVSLNVKKAAFVLLLASAVSRLFPPCRYYLL